MDIDWNSHFQDNSIHECWGELSQKLEEAVRKHIPTKTIHPDVRTRPLWMNKEVSTKVILKQRAWRKSYLSTFENFPGVESARQLVSDSLPITRGRYK